MRLTGTIRAMFILLVASSLGAAGASRWAATVSAQSAVDVLSWSTPEQIPGYADDTGRPWLVADENRTIHAFNSQVINGVRMLVYSQWSQDKGWSLPNDIVVSPNGTYRDAILVDVTVGDDFSVHMVFYVGVERRGWLYHTSAPLILAGDSQAWTSPVIVTSSFGPLLSGQLLWGNGVLTLIHTHMAQGRDGVAATVSRDGGQNWGEPKELYMMGEYGKEQLIFAIEAYRTQDDVFHVVWTNNNMGGNGDSISYCRYEPGIGCTERLSTLAVAGDEQGGTYETDWPSLIEHDGELIVFYNDGVALRLFRRSLDDGMTWSEPVEAFPGYMGEYNTAALVSDEAGGLHVLVGQRTSDSNHGMWHSTRSGDAWTPLSPVVNGPRVVSPPGTDGFDPNGPRAVISQGNLLFVIWLTDSGAGPNGVWYSFAELPLPESPVRQLPRPDPAVARPRQSSELAETVSRRPPVEDPGDRGADSDPPSSRPGRSVLGPADFRPAGEGVLRTWVLALLPVVIILTWVIFTQRRRR